jgi:predicted Zn-dependent protease
MTGGLEINRQTDSFDIRWGDVTARGRRLELYSPAAWLTRSEGDGTQPFVNWCDARERGVYSIAFQLGRVRASKPKDLRTPPLELADYSLSALDRAYGSNYTAELQAQGKGRMLLILRHVTSTGYETRVLVDTDRHVILSIEQRFEGKVSSVTKFNDFVEVAGSWWATRIETTDDQGRRSSLTTKTVKALTAAELAARIKKELAGREHVQFVHQPLPRLAEAKGRLHAGKATFDDQIVLLLHFANSQQWTRVREHLEQAERLAAGKAGLRWLHNMVLSLSRRHEELKKRLLDEAVVLVNAPDSAVPPEELFLAEYVFGQATGVLAADEMLALLDHLRPLYQRQPAHVRALKLWGQHRVNYLNQVGRVDEALRLYKELATEYPHDYTLQQQYAQALANVGEYEAAYAWLTQVLTKEARWLPQEEEVLRNTYAQLLEGQSRFPELVEYLAAWEKQNPEGYSAYQQYLSALIRADQLDKANALIAQWLKEGQVPKEPTPAVASRLRAAVYQALGQGHSLYSNRIEERWLVPLGQAVLYFARHGTQLDLANSIMSSNPFQQSDEVRRVRKATPDILSAELDKLTSLQIQYFVGWISPNDPPVESAVWKKLADGLRRRWAAEPKPEVKNQLAQVLVQVLTNHASAAELVAFLHRQWREGPEAYRAAYASELFNTLLAQPWSAEYEDEAFSLLDKLSDATEADARLAVQVEALYRLTDRMVQARFAAPTGAIEHQEKLTRTQLREKREQSLRQARTGVADHLRREAVKHAGPLGQWLTVEGQYLDTLLERDVKAVATACWKFLGNRPPKPLKPEDMERMGPRLEAVLWQRNLLTAADLAVRKGTEPALIDRLLKYVDQGIADDAEDTGWKRLKYEVLVALDRSKELEQVLRQWVAVGDPDSRWRLSLGYLLAEQGRIAEAIKLFEGVEVSDELGPFAYRALADWYMATNRRELHDRALVAVYKTAPEWQLTQRLYTLLRPWQSGGLNVPTQLDPDVLLLFQALLEKSSLPQNYLWYLRSFYQASRDSRLLAGLADAVVGHTAGEVYPFLSQLQPILAEIRDEATANSLVQRVAKVRAQAQTVVDRRALDLLEMLVERRSAEVQNQPVPHVQAALAALQRAFQRTWSVGEPRLMADLLGSLDAISQAALAAEQLRELEVLHRKAAKGAADRLHIGQQWSVALAAYGRLAGATDLLQADLKEFLDAHGGVLPVSDNDVLTTLVAFHTQAGHFTRGEDLLLAQIKHAVHQQQALWLTERLYDVYAEALQNGGEVSLGAGQTLYTAVGQRLQAALTTHDQNHRANVINVLCRIYRVAYNKKLAGVVDDLNAFAFRRLPQALAGQVNHYESMVSNVAQAIRVLAGARDAIAFLLDRIEHEPSWLHYTNQDSWSRYSSNLAEWRSVAKLSADLENRLLKLVLAELRRDLESRQQSNRVMFDRRYSNYWPEKEKDFAKTAEDVLAQRSGSGTAVVYIAEYLYRGLNHANRAIEVLFAGHNQNVLDENGEFQLVAYLQEQNRYGESVALLQTLIARRPDNLNYRVRLMHAYFHTSRPAELLALLKETDARFHEPGRWTEAVMATLGGSCLENQLYDRSVAYYKEAISLHQRTQPRMGVGDGTLADYYRGQAAAYAGLHQTAEAVDAASGAIVAWGPDHQQRAQALETLRQVLRQSADLNAYVAVLDKSTLQSPIVRKALGEVYLEKGKFAQAIAQLRLAAELQPNDAEVYQKLVECYDKQGDKEGAIAQLLQAAQLSRRDIKVYQELGRRLAELHRPAEAERAYTSIVEVLPSESESHTLLAEVRQSENRWAEAIVQWQQVVRIRALQPTGLLKLAGAQIHERQWQQAKETLRTLERKDWPVGFADVEQQVRELRKQIEKATK